MSDMRNSENSLAVEIIDRRKCENTKTKYSRKVEHFKKWINDAFPECINTDFTLNLTMIDTDHLRQFLVHICKKKDAKRDYLSPTVYHAFQHVSGYKSAIKDYYNNKNVKISEDSERMMEQFFKDECQNPTQCKTV